MAAAEGLPDALSLLRAIITTGQPLPIPSSTSDASTATDTQVSLAAASYLIFNAQNAHTAIPLTQPTRFISTAAGNKSFDLRTVYFVWQIRDKNAGQVISETAALNQELQALGKDGEQVPNTAFLERVDLNDWLDGKTGESESEFIQPLDGGKTTRREAADAAGVASGDVEMRDADDVAGKGEQERLREIYAAERKLGDRNLVLRGVKVQDFSDVRKKYSMLFFAKARQQQNGAAPPLNSNPALRPPVKQTAPGRRPEPIILLSPSASSLLRMPNIKSFLEEGIYTTPDTGSSANLLHLTRTLPSISPQKPIRFILVDDPSSFRPDYWDRLVAVFTTGQTWQFKNYKWQQPAELFSHALGIYVGWKGEVIPDTVRGWGRGVMVAQIDKGGARWRDKEVVEELWRGIEARMKGMGWGKEQRCVIPHSIGALNERPVRQLLNAICAVYPSVGTALGGLAEWASDVTADPPREPTAVQVELSTDAQISDPSTPLMRFFRAVPAAQSNLPYRIPPMLEPDEAQAMEFPGRIVDVEIGGMEATTLDAQQDRSGDNDAEVGFGADKRG